MPQAAVAALNKLSGGPHAGYRSNHVKGVLVTGSFVPAASAAALTSAPHLNGKKAVPVLVCFSNGTGVPNLPDLIAVLATPDAGLKADRGGCLSAWRAGGPGHLI